MEDSAQRQYKRQLKSVLIHKPMQREFILVVISLLIISALTIGFVIHGTIREAMMGGGYRFGKITPYEVMSDVSYDLIVRVSLVLFVTILVIAIFGVLFLHRIAGPVYRFRNVLRHISQGEIPGEFHLREGDFFTETAEDLNVVLEKLRQKRERIDSLKQKLEAASRENANPSLQTFVRELRDSLEELR